MRLTKHAHATVVLEQDGHEILIDPGSFTPDAAGLLRTATDVLVTHDHVDHLDATAVRMALAERSHLRLWGPPSVTAAFRDTRAAAEGRVATVSGGEHVDLGGVRIRVVGGPHHPVHDGIPVPHNVGYLVGDLVFHPGDSYLVPGVDVHTLLVPVSGPWTRIGDAIDFITAVAPSQTVLIHDAMLSEIGLASSAMFLGQDGLTGTPVLGLEPGRPVDL